MGIQHLFVVTLDVVVGTHLKQLCLWIYIQHVSLDTQMVVIVAFVTVSHSYFPHNQSELNFRLPLKYLEFY